MKIIRLFSRLNVGGPSLHVVNLSAGLNAYGYETILAVGSISEHEGDMSYYASQKNVLPFVVPGFQAEIAPLKDLLALYQIYKLIKREKPDIVHTHTFKAGLLGRIAAFFVGTPLIVHTYHGHLLHGYGSKFKTLIITNLERFLNLFTDQVITVSDQVAADLVRHKVVPAKKINTIELGFDIQLLEAEAQQKATLRERLQLGPDKILIGLAGRLVAIKSIDLFLKSTAPLIREFPQLHIVVLGDGPEQQKLKALAQEISPRIHFTGFILPLTPEFKDLDLLVCSSKNEGTSVSVIEALICGVPVISTAVGGMPDLLGFGKWGTLVPYDEQKLTQAMREQIRILSSRNSPEFTRAKLTQKNIQIFFKKRFSLDRLISDLHRIYSSKKDFANHALKIQNNSTNLDSYFDESELAEKPRPLDLPSP